MVLDLYTAKTGVNMFVAPLPPFPPSAGVPADLVYAAAGEMLL